MTNFLIVRLSSLGDIIHTLPAYSLLRESLPEAEIYWATQGKSKEILDLVPGLKKIIDINSNLIARTFAIRQKRIDVALDFQGLIKSAFLTFLSGAKRRLGFNRQNLKEPMAHIFYTETMSTLKEFDHHVIYKNLKLLELLGLTIDWNPEALKFPLFIPEEIKNRVKTKLEEIGLTLNKPLVIFNVGASWPSKRLPVPLWIETINLAKKELNDHFHFALLWGNQEEFILAKNIQQPLDIYLLPFFNIKETIALISSTALLVSGDTFALQVASALKIPIVGLFGPTSPIRNGPFRPQDAYIYSSVSCSPCYQRRCARPRCWEDLSPSTIVSAIINRIKKI